jgi:hypothetical protein
MRFSNHMIAVPLPATLKLSLVIRDRWQGVI